VQPEVGVIDVEPVQIKASHGTLEETVASEFD
jgi:hypothetical protein